MPYTKPIAARDSTELSKVVWRNRLAPFAKPNRWRAAIQLATTALLLLAISGALVYGLQHGFWLAWALILPASLLVVRLFIIQHDCGHGSYFGARHADRTTGMALSLLTMMPYTSWRRAHNIHHATSSNLDRRGTGDITMLTVAEYRALPAWRRLAYRIYRHPLVLFGIGPAYVLLIRYRLPMGSPIKNWGEWVSVLGTDLAFAAMMFGIFLIAGSMVFLVAWGMVLLLATSTGMWLFYVQHQFEDGYWEHSAHWDFHAAALEGSSFYDLPRFLHWFTGSIGLHHIHHLASKIPNYRLQACFEQTPELQKAKRLTLWDSIKSVRLTLWDEDERTLKSFRQVAASCA